MSKPRSPQAMPLSGPMGRRLMAHRSQVLDVLRRHGVSGARVFGSVARGEDRVDSDIDMLVSLPPNTGLLAIGRLEAELEAVLGARVDVVPDADLKANVRVRVERDLVGL